MQVADGLADPIGISAACSEIGMRLFPTTTRQCSSHSEPVDRPGQVGNLDRPLLAPCNWRGVHVAGVHGLHARPLVGGRRAIACSPRLGLCRARDCSHCATGQGSVKSPAPECLGGHRTRSLRSCTCISHTLCCHRLRMLLPASAAAAAAPAQRPAHMHASTRARRHLIDTNPGKFKSITDACLRCGAAV